MRRTIIEPLALALALGGAGLALSQQPGAPPGGPQVPGQPGAPPSVKKEKASPDKSKLESLLAEALRNSPDIRVATARLATAEAELNQARLQVTQKIITLHAAIESQKAEVSYRQKQFERYKQLADQRAIEAKLVDEARDRLTLAKAKLAELEAQMPALLGKVARAGDRADGEGTVGQELFGLWLRDSTVLQNPADPTVRRRLYLDVTGTLPPPDQLRIEGSMANTIRKALETPVPVNYRAVPFHDVLKDLEKKVPGLMFRNHYQRLAESPVTMSFDRQLPVAAVLEALEDYFLSEGKTDGEALRFVVRQYGLLVTAQGYVPPRALTVQEFLRQNPKPKPAD